MERKEFERKYEAASEYINPLKLYAEENRTMDSAPINIGKGTRNLVIVIEELAELQQQLSKYLRGKEDRLGLIEETADVLMALDYVKEICGITDAEINKAINVKLQRLKETDGVYQ